MTLATIAKSKVATTASIKVKPEAWKVLRFMVKVRRYALKRTAPKPWLGLRRMSTVQKTG